MKKSIGLVIISTCLLACGTETVQNVSAPTPKSMVGTWQLVRGTLIEKGDTTVTDYTTYRSFIKVINNTHFSFLGHDLTKGKDSATFFTSGGGHYSLTDSVYTEHLEYCSDRNWEGHDFTFSVSINDDTLIQRGIEKIESAGIDRINVEKYVKVKK